MNTARPLDHWHEQEPEPPATRRARLAVLVQDEPEPDCASEMARCGKCGSATLHEHTIDVPQRHEEPARYVTVTVCSTCNHHTPPGAGHE